PPLLRRLGVGLTVLAAFLLLARLAIRELPRRCRRRRSPRLQRLDLVAKTLVPLLARPRLVVGHPLLRPVRLDQLDLLEPLVGLRGRGLVRLLPDRHGCAKNGSALLQSGVDTGMLGVPVDPRTKAAGRRVEDSEIAELLALAEPDLLPPVIRRRMVPAEVAAAKDLARLLDRAREAVTDAGHGSRVEEARRVEVGDENVVHRVGELVGLRRIAHLDEELDAALSDLR